MHINYIVLGCVMQTTASSGQTLSALTKDPEIAGRPKQTE